MLSYRDVLPRPMQLRDEARLEATDGEPVLAVVPRRLEQIVEEHAAPPAVSCCHRLHASGEQSRQQGSSRSQHYAPH